MSGSATGTKQYTCGFCDRAAGDGTVDRLIAGPGRIAICDACVLEGLSLVVAHSGAQPGAGPAMCRFCAMTTGTSVLIDRPASGVTICAQCLALCLEILQEEMSKGEWETDRRLPSAPAWVAAVRRDTPLAPPSVITIDAFDPTRTAASNTEQREDGHACAATIEEAVVALELAVSHHHEEALSADRAARLAARLAAVHEQLLALARTDQLLAHHGQQANTTAIS